nr:integrase, catalytic region, zinc finger, CCHC-type, peptidase aspartic, catalytic [Tanacetum cinerariifolium]
MILPEMTLSQVFQSSNIIRNIFVLPVSKEKAKEHLIHQNQFQIQGRDYIYFHMDLCGPMRIASINGKRWSATGRLFNQEGKLVDSSESKRKSDYGYSDLFMVRRFGLFQAYDRKTKASHQFHLEVYGNWQFCNLDLEVVFKRNACFVRNLEGVDLLKGDRSTNLYTINLHEISFASPIYLMARASSTKSWLWHQRLSHLNFDTINDLAKNDLVVVPNSRQRLHLLHMDLCRPMRISSINGKRYVLVIVDDYSRYTWVHFLISKNEAPEVIIKFLKRISVLLQSPVIIIRTDNGTEFKNQVLKEYFDIVGISHQIKPDISFLHVFGALCYPKNDHEDIGKLGAKGDIGFFIGYSADSVLTEFTTVEQRK